MRVSEPAVFPSPQNWERQFVAAVREQAWRPALDTLTANGPLTLTRAAACPDVGQALTILIAWAPLERLTAVRRQLSPEVFPQDSDAVFRFSFLLQMSQAHLELAGLYGKEGQLGAAIAHTHWGLSGLLVPRSPKHEMVASAGFMQLARFIGEAELVFAERWPEFEDSPDCVSPMETALRGKVTFPAGYDPGALGDLLGRCVSESAASDEMLRCAVQGIFELAHWPSWQALLARRPCPRLAAAARVVLQEKDGISTAAMRYLERLAESQT